MNRDDCRRSHRWLVALVAGALCASCGPGHDRVGTIGVEPDAVDLSPGQEQPFRAQVTGLEDASVDWSASGGSILDPDGRSMRFRAPDVAGDYVVRAVSRADPGLQASARVRVATRDAAVVLDPATAAVPALGEQSWVATTSGTTSQGVSWSSDGGAFVVRDAFTARWQAPALAGRYHVFAAAPAGAASAVATVDVTATGGGAPLVLWITPLEVELTVGGRAAFVLGISTNEAPGIDTSVDWSATGGSLEINNAVTYVAAEVGRQLVIVRSRAYPGVAASASVIVR